MSKGLLEISIASLNLEFSTLLFSLWFSTASHGILHLSNFVYIYINYGAFAIKPYCCYIKELLKH